MSAIIICSILLISIILALVWAWKSAVNRVKDRGYNKAYTIDEFELAVSIRQNLLDSENIANKPANLEEIIPPKKMRKIIIKPKQVNQEQKKLVEEMKK